MRRGPFKEEGDRQEGTGNEQEQSIIIYHIFIYIVKLYIIYKIIIYLTYEKMSQ